MNKKGFTLIEVLIVIAIIGILTAIFIPEFLKAKGEYPERKAVQTTNSLSESISDCLKEKYSHWTEWSESECNQRNTTEYDCILSGKNPDGNIEIVSIKCFQKEGCFECK